MTHTVINGDTLSKISEMYYGDWSMVDAIAALNNITDKDVIYPGMVLKLPNAPVQASVVGGVDPLAALIITGLVIVGVKVYNKYFTK